MSKSWLRRGLNRLLFHCGYVPRFKLDFGCPATSGGRIFSVGVPQVTCTIRRPCGEQLRTTEMQLAVAGADVSWLSTIEKVEPLSEVEPPQRRRPGCLITCRQPVNEILPDGTIEPRTDLVNSMECWETGNG